MSEGKHRKEGAPEVQAGRARRGEDSRSMKEGRVVDHHQKEEVGATSKGGYEKNRHFVRGQERKRKNTRPSQGDPITSLNSLEPG